MAGVEEMLITLRPRANVKRDVSANVSLPYKQDLAGGGGGGGGGWGNAAPFPSNLAYITMNQALVAEF